MKHHIHLTGHAYALRPVELADAALIVELRSDPQRTRFLHPIEPTLAAQQAYLERYFARPDDYYFAVERRASRRTEGLIGLYDLDPDVGSMEVGRWVLRPGSWAAHESLWLALRVGFEMLRLREIHGRAALVHTSVVSFHSSFGSRRRAVLPPPPGNDGDQREQIESFLSADDWPALSESHSRRAARVARWLERKAVVT